MRRVTWWVVKIRLKSLCNRPHPQTHLIVRRLPLFLLRLSLKKLLWLLLSAAFFTLTFCSLSLSFVFLWCSRVSPGRRLCRCNSTLGKWQILCLFTCGCFFWISGRTTAVWGLSQCHQLCLMSQSNKREFKYSCNGQILYQWDYICQGILFSWPRSILVFNLPNNLKIQDIKSL